MSKNSNSSTSTGLSFSGLLTILFIALKLTGYIDWSWWWVLSPLWMGVAFVLLVIGILAVPMGVQSIIKRRKLKKKMKDLQS